MMEIERKYLVAPDGAWRALIARSEEMDQGYLCEQPTVRVRRVGKQRAFLTIKGPATGISRAEFEYDIDPEEAQIMLDTLCLPGRIKKTRHHLQPLQGKLWTIDEFYLENKGLFLAEIELEDEAESFDIPAWAIEEVSHDPRYRNSSLARSPRSSW